ncbi:unnamed protein product [Symbiodinium natans]|uniref:Uncharacterized protein n=1 Tax=Symbiodinium natans TaxID=878477 RepID=A0A812QXZ5_9DINO|nr:unnamed protein product [Symbiodinium natans]
MDAASSITLRALHFIEGEAGSGQVEHASLLAVAAEVRAAAASGREADIAAAVFRLAQRSLTLPFGAASSEFAAAACAAVAGMTEPELLGKVIGRSHILRVLEELARHVDTYQPYIFSFLSRTGYGQIAGLDASARRMQAALSSICVWLLAAFCRAVGYRCFSAEILWEWSNADPLFIGLLVRSTLTLELLCQLVPESPLGGLLLPADLRDLQTVVFRALLGLTRPDIVFADVVPKRAEREHATMEVQSPALHFARHWSRLAVAASETGLVPILLDVAEGLMSDEKFQMPAFFAKMLNASLQDSDVCLADEELFQACHVASAHLRDAFNDADNASRLWRILCDILLKNGLVRSFLRDCAELALATPGIHCVAFLQTAAGLQMEDLAAMPGLCCVAANAHLAPVQVAEFAKRLMELEEKERCIVAGELERWKGPVMQDMKAAWVALLRAVPAPLMADAPPAPPRTPLRTAQRRVLAVGGLEELLVKAPPDLSCAFDGQLLTDPVLSPYGHLFDRASLAGMEAAAH